MATPIGPRRRGHWMRRRRVRFQASVGGWDTANIYSGGSSEEITGRALCDMAQRDEIVVATKAFFPWKNAPNAGFLSRKALM